MTELEIEALKRRLETVAQKGSTTIWCSEAEAIAVLAALEDRERGRALLLEWGCHKSYCAVEEGPDYVCTCGWADLEGPRWLS